MMDEPENPKKSQSQVERWLGQRKSAWLKKSAWRDGYDFLMATKPGIRYYDAFLAVWLSVSKRDRGTLKTQQDFADFIGVSRAVTYQWMNRRPQILEWAEELVELRFNSTRVADVDERVYQKAASVKSTPAWARLFYQRAGRLTEELDLHHSGEEGGPVEYADVTRDELQRIRSALSGEAQGGGAPG
jgi:hypothetical protein